MAATRPTVPAQGGCSIINSRFGQGVGGLGRILGMKDAWLLAVKQISGWR